MSEHKKGPEGPAGFGAEPHRKDGPDYKKTVEVAAFKGGTAEHAFMSEMMHRFDTLQSSVDSLRQDTKEELQKHGTASYKAHEETRRHVTQLTKMVRILWANVKGSDPPPPPSPEAALSFSMSDPSVIVGEKKNPMHRQVSEHDASLDSVQGHLIAVDASLNETRGEVKQLLTLQREQMGKHEGAVLRQMLETVKWCVTTRDGHKFMMLLAVAVITVLREVQRLGL